MKDVIVFAVELGGVVVALAVLGVVLVRRGQLVYLGLHRYALLAAALAAATGLLLLQATHFAARFTEVDTGFALVLIGTGTYVINWTCVRLILNRRADVTVLHESSLLSMLYAGSRQDMPGFEETVLVPPDKVR